MKIIFISLILKPCALVFSLPYIIYVKLFSRRYKNVAIALSSVKGEFGFFVRENFYSKTLEACGFGLRVHYGAFICYPSVRVGNNVTIEEYSIVGKCSIGNDTILAARVSIMSGAHHHDLSDTDTLFRESIGKISSVNIGNNVWVGTHAVLMNDVGDHCAIGAAAVVTKVIKPYSVAVGVPAQIIRDRRMK